MTGATARHAASSRSIVRTPRLGVVAAAVVGILVVALAAACGDTSPARSHAAVAGRAVDAALPGEPVTMVAASAPRTGAPTPEPPQRAVLPSGTAVPVVEVSTTDDGALDVPGDVDVAGWWRGGSRIGDPFGAVLLSAHVDSATQGLGPYVELLRVRRGQSVLLTSEHLRQKYVINSLQLLDKGSLSDHPWVYSASGPHRLVLVTCAGPFDASRGGYQRLAVVTATAAGGPTSKGS